MLMLPFFNEPPGILIGKSPTTQVNMVYQIAGDRNVQKLARRVITDKKMVSVHFDMVAFMRMLAKIAHAFAVAEIGLDDLDPDLLDLMYGRNICTRSLSNRILEYQCAIR